LFAGNRDSLERRRCHQTVPVGGWENANKAVENGPQMNEKTIILNPYATNGPDGPIFTIHR